MVLKKIGLCCVFSAFLLSGCDKKVENTAAEDMLTCDRAEAKDGLRDGLIKKISDQLALGHDEAELNQMMLFAKTLDVVVTGHRTVSADKEHNKVECKATVDVVFPNEMIEKISLDYQTENHKPFSLLSYLSEGDGIFRKNAQTLSSDVRYEAQETDDKKQIYYTSDLGSLGETVAMVLENLAPNKAEVHHEDEKSEETVAVENSSKTDEDAEAYEQAKYEQRIAEVKLNTLWNDLPKEIQNNLREEQRAWIKKRRDLCDAEMVNMPEKITNSMKQGSVGLACEASHALKRYEELKQYHVPSSEYENKEAEEVGKIEKENVQGYDYK